MNEQKQTFAICIRAADEALITPRRIYRILPDETAARSEYVRIIDDEGEDYLYPKSDFVFMPFPAEIEAVLLQSN